MDKLKKQFGAIYDQCINKIYRFIFIKVNSQEVAEDLTSETFLKGWKAFKKASNPHIYKIDNPSAFLYQIARNLVIVYYRKKGRVQLVSTDSDQIADPRLDLEIRAVANSDMEVVRAALENINDDYREVIVWYYLDDLSIPEIAKITRKSEGAVRVMVHRALDSLRANLGAKGTVTNSA